MPASISDNESPILLFICGPTGSGKSKLVNKTLEHIEKPGILGEGNQNFKSYDNIIETNSLYKRLMFALYYYHFTDTNGDLISDDINEKINTPVNVREYNTALKLEKLNFKNPQADGTMELADYASSIYYAFRDLPSCGHNESRDATCSRIYDESIKKLIENNESVAIETNATKGYLRDFVGWYKDFTETNTDFLNKYKVIYSYAFVEFCENLRRIKKRFTDGLKTFIEYYKKKLKEKIQFTEKTDILENLKTEYFNDDENAVRLPEIDIYTFGNKIETIRNTLLENIECLSDCNDNILKELQDFKPKNQRVIIFNTIETGSEVMYDSADNALKSDVTNTTNIYNDVKKTCGGRKRTKRRKKLKKKKISNKTRQKKRKKMVRIR